MKDWNEAKKKALELFCRAQDATDYGERARLAVRARDALRGFPGPHACARHVTRFIASMKSARGPIIDWGWIREIEAMIRLLETAENPEACTRERLRQCWPSDDWDGREAALSAGCSRLELLRRQASG